MDNKTGHFPQAIHCVRCGIPCRITGKGNPDAKMLRWAQGPGLCVNCAVHDFLRHTYPINMMLARSGPRNLLIPHVQEQFAGIMKVAMADAMPDEIDWELIVENWDLPFRHKMKKGPMNPVTQEELDRIAAGEERHPEDLIKEAADKEKQTQAAIEDMKKLLRKQRTESDDGLRGPDKTLFEI